MTNALHARARARALGLALAVSGPVAGLPGCADENPPIGSISAPRSEPKASGKEVASAKKKKGDPNAGQNAKERLGLGQ